MNDPVISRFAEACGAAGPLDLRVDLADGGLLAKGSVPMPFTLIGRDDACDVTLTDAEVNPRHAWLQILAGRVFAVDLGSRTGLGWPGGQTGSGWMNTDSPVRIGPFQVRVRSPISPRPASFRAGHNPLQSDPASLRSLPSVSLEFRNGKRAKDRWTVNRLITLVGRAPECKIHLTADDIAGYHCGLVLTPDGLWVVDLSARGVVVNGERMRVSPLPHGAELWVGRFLIGVQYPGSAATPPLGRAGLATPATPLPGLAEEPREVAGQADRWQIPDAPGTTDADSDSPEDEVLLGLVPTADSDAGLPSSHIMADAFRLWTPDSGPGSHPIAVSGSGPKTPVGPPTIVTVPPRTTPPPALLDMLATPDPIPTPSLPPKDDAVAVLRQLGDVHAQLFAQFQNSLVLMVRLFGCLRPEQLPLIQQELARIQAVNAELAQLQGELASRAAGAATPQPDVPIAASPPTPTPTPAPSPDSTALHEWVMHRINALQGERKARWESLVGMFAGKPA